MDVEGGVDLPLCLIIISKWQLCLIDSRVTTYNILQRIQMTTMRLLSRQSSLFGLSGRIIVRSLLLYQW